MGEGRFDLGVVEGQRRDVALAELDTLVSQRESALDRLGLAESLRHRARTASKAGQFENASKDVTRAIRDTTPAAEKTKRFPSR